MSLRGKTGRPWTEREKKFVTENFALMDYAELGHLIDRSKLAIQGFLDRNGLRLPEDEYKRRRNECLKLGRHTGVNKGQHLSRATEFKKGNKPGNTKGEGALTIRWGRKDNKPSMWKKLSDSHWMPYAHYIWQQSGRKIEKGMCIWFINGNPLDCRIENLEMITRSENLRRNSNLPLRSLKLSKEMGKFIKENYPDLIQLNKIKLELQNAIKRTGTET